MERVQLVLLALLCLLIIGTLFVQYRRYEGFEEGAQDNNGSSNDSNAAPAPAPEPKVEQDQGQSKKTKAEECEDRYNDLVKRKEAEDASIRDAQAEASKQQSLIDATKDAEWKDRVAKADAQLKISMAQQKEAEDKLADVNAKKADCEGKLTGVDPSIKNARECCDKEREGRDKAVAEAAQSSMIANQLAATNQALVDKKIAFEAKVKQLQAFFDSCNKEMNELQSQNASLRAQL